MEAIPKRCRACLYFILSIYSRWKNDPLIQWKDSIKKILMKHSFL